MSGSCRPPHSPVLSSSPECPPLFDCAVSSGDPISVWIRLEGELDLASVPQMTQVLRQSAASARLIVVDLRGVTFMDCAGLQVIIAAESDARRRGARFVLAPGPAQVERLLELVGLAEHFDRIDPGQAATIVALKSSIARPAGLLGGSII